MNNVLDWSKYGLVLPVDLINKTNYNKFISQEALDVLAPYPLQGKNRRDRRRDSVGRGSGVSGASDQCGEP